MTTEQQGGWRLTKEQLVALDKANTDRFFAETLTAIDDAKAGIITREEFVERARRLHEEGLSVIAEAQARELVRAVESIAIRVENGETYEMPRYLTGPVLVIDLERWRWLRKEVELDD